MKQDGAVILCNNVRCEIQHRYGGLPQCQYFMSPLIVPIPPSEAHVPLTPCASRSRQSAGTLVGR